MDHQKLFYISGAVFFILASVLALGMLFMMFGSQFID